MLDRSYHFNRLLVHLYCGKYQLSLPSSGASIDEIEVIDEVMMNFSELDDEGHVMQAATMLVVQLLENVYTCILCKRGKKVIPDQTGSIRSCEICPTDQKLHVLHLTAKLLLEDENAHDCVILRAYHDTLIVIVDSDVTTQDLLNAPQFDVHYDDYRRAC